MDRKTKHPEDVLKEESQEQGISQKKPSEMQSITKR